MVVACDNRVFVVISLKLFFSPTLPAAAGAGPSLALDLSVAASIVSSNSASPFLPTRPLISTDSSVASSSVSSSFSLASSSTLCTLALSFICSVIVSDFTPPVGTPDKRRLAIIASIISGEYFASSSSRIKSSLCSKTSGSLAIARAASVSALSPVVSVAPSVGNTPPPTGPSSGDTMLSVLSAPLPTPSPPATLDSPLPSPVPVPALSASSAVVSVVSVASPASCSCT